MESNELFFARGVLLRLAQAAREDRGLLPEVREIVMQSGILHVFGEGQTLDVVSVLDAGGEGLLRTRLGALSLADLRRVVQANAFDPEGVTSRWRSPSRLIALVVGRAVAVREERQRALLEQQYAIALATTAATTPTPAASDPEPAEAPKRGASWML